MNRKVFSTRYERNTKFKRKSTTVVLKSTGNSTWHIMRTIEIQVESLSGFSAAVHTSNFTVKDSYDGEFCFEDFKQPDEYEINEL